MPAHPVIRIRYTALDIGIGPAFGPVVICAEFGRTIPVITEQLGGITDAVAALQARTAKQHTAKGLVGEAAEILAGAALQQGHAPAAIQ